MKNICKYLREHAVEIFNFFKKHEFMKKHQKSFENATVCCIFANKILKTNMLKIKKL